MRVATAETTELQTDSVLELYEGLIAELGGAPEFLMVACSSDYDIEQLSRRILERTPDTALHGGTSCMGGMTNNGIVSKDGHGIVMMGIADPHGNYGVGSAVIDSDPVAAAELAVQDALANSNCPGEMPAMIWLTSSPGSEELIIQGIGNILGDDVPISGGSVADNTITGDWKLFTRDSVFDSGLVVTAMFPSTDVMFAFQNGYEPTERKGVATGVGEPDSGKNDEQPAPANKRLLREIDGKPAAEIYNDWLDGALSPQLQARGSILQQTSLYPIGRIAGYIGDFPYYQLSHPETITEDGGLSLFSEVEAGEELILMKGSIDSLISRAGRVALSALDANMSNSSEIAGALLIYCAGCMLTVRPRLDEVVDSFRQALPGVPFLGMFTFGEQGCFFNGENRHGNLMISVLLLKKDSAW